MSNLFRKRTIFVKTRYKSVNKGGGVHDGGEGWCCDVCRNVWKATTITPHWKYCPACGNKIIAWRW